MNRRWDWSAPRAASRPWASAVGVLLGLAMIGFGRLWTGVGMVVVGTVLAGAWAVWPTSTARFVRGFSDAVGRVIGVMALTAVFGLVIVPLSVIRRGDPLALEKPGEDSTFWRKRGPRAPDSRRRWS